MGDQNYSVLFWLNKSKMNAKGTAPIWARITVEGKRAECSTSNNIEPDFWNADAGLPTSDYHLAGTLKQQLRRVEVEINKHYNMLASTTEYVTADDIKASYLGKRKKRAMPLIEWMDDYNKALKKRVEKKELSESYYEKFVYLRDKCKTFITTEFKKSDLLIRDLRLPFIEGLYHFLVGEMASNTAMDYCKKLKHVMMQAVKHEYIPSSHFQFFRCSFKKAKRTFLTDEELEALMSTPMPVKRLQQVRDAFVFCCHTGYAIVDARNLSPENVQRGLDGNLWIIRDRQKCDTVENVPLLPIALKIIDKYKDHPACIRRNKLLPLMSSQNYNIYLKEIAAICRISKNLTSHVARHTFATTVTLTNDVPIETVSKLLGHMDIRTTQIYAQIVAKKLSTDMNALKRKLSRNDTSAKKPFRRSGKRLHDSH